jgi:hypothetical protein
MHNCGQYGLDPFYYSSYEEEYWCLTLLESSWRNGFDISQLTSMVAIDLQKPYAKTKVGESYTCIDVY